MMASIRRGWRLLIEFCRNVVRAVIWVVTWLHQMRIVLGVHGVRRRVNRWDGLRLWNGDLSERYILLWLTEIGIWSLCLGIEWSLRQKILI